MSAGRPALRPAESTAEPTPLRSYDRPERVAATTERTLIATPADTIKFASTEWAWVDRGRPRIPTGSLCLLAGREATNKSTWAASFAASISTGDLEGAWQGRARSVLYASTEDSWPRTIGPRLAAAGADLSRVHQLAVKHGDTVDTPVLPDDVERLADKIETGDYGLVVFDPLISMLGDGLDPNKARQVRSALEPVMAAADRTGCVVAAIVHFNKAQVQDALTAISGSSAFRELARSIFAFAREDGSQRIMTQLKNNLGPDDLPSLRYEVESTTVPTDDGVASVSRLVFKGDSATTVHDLYGEQAAVQMGKTERAAAWLQGVLAGAGGELSAKRLETLAADAGYPERTLKRAKTIAGVESVQAGGGWQWRLSDARQAPTNV